MHTWTSPSPVFTNEVPRADRIEATLAVGIELTPPELTAARTPAGFIHDQILSFREDDDFPQGDDVISKTTATYTFVFGPTTSHRTMYYCPPGYVTTLGAWIGGLLEGDTAAFKIRAHWPPASEDTGQIWLSPGAAAGGVARVPRTSTPGITYLSEFFHTGQAPTPSSPLGTGFRVYSFTTPNTTALGL